MELEFLNCADPNPNFISNGVHPILIFVVNLIVYYYLRIEGKSIRIHEFTVHVINIFSIESVTK